VANFIAGVFDQQLQQVTTTKTGVPVRDLHLRPDGNRIVGEVQRLDGSGLWQPTTWLLSGLHQINAALNLDLTPLQ